MVKEKDNYKWEELMADVDGGHKIYISEPSRHHGFGGGLKQ